ncbi:MAG: MFS transporter [Sarcina sp.]
MKSNKFTRAELTFVSLLSLALGVRQLATALISAYISNYAQSLQFGTVELAAISLGIFGLLQAIFQIPFGVLSDKLNKKFIILLGLFMLGAGLVLTVVSDNVYVFIFARGLQGAGAIAASAFAWLSMGVKESKVSNAINIAGIGIGLASAIGLSGGTILGTFMSFEQLTYLDAACVIISFVLILIFLKAPKVDESKVVKKGKMDSEFWAYLGKLLKVQVFTLLNIQSFIANYVIMSIFFVVPEYLGKIPHGMSHMWEIFVPATIIAVILMRFSMNFISRGKTGEIFVISLALMCGGMAFFLLNTHIVYLIIGTTLFMIGYNIIVTLIPTITNKVIDKDEYRGTVNGIINTFLYFGSFVGSVVTGAVWSEFGAGIALYSIIGVALISLLMGVYLLFTSKELRAIK